MTVGVSESPYNATFFVGLLALNAALNLEALRAAALCRDPYDYLIVQGFVREAALPVVVGDYPAIEHPGSFPVSELSYGPAFDALLDELESPVVAQAFGEKFGVDLAGKPTLVTVRGRCQAKDGRIHTDSRDKILTVLIYMNPSWDETGGRLRVLRSATNLEDFAAEVPPVAGSMLAFRRSESSFHGHQSFVGPRRVVQLNWLVDDRVASRERARHRLSAWTKRLNPFA